VDELIEGDKVIDFDKLFITTYPPRSIKDIILEKGFFHKILLPIYLEEEE
tara:strand:+ start:503 stop:652 length:150 start_codon:yes stop_codon:yes gene_type:complete